MFDELGKTCQGIPPGITMTGDEGLQHTQIIYLASGSMVFDPSRIVRRIPKLFFSGQKPQNFRFRIDSGLQLAVHLEQQTLTIQNAGIVPYCRRYPAGKQFRPGWRDAGYTAASHARQFRAVSTVHFSTSADQMQEQLPESLEVDCIAQNSLNFS